MSLLPRAVYLLTTARAAAAVDPLLSILIRHVESGEGGWLELGTGHSGSPFWVIQPSRRSCQTP